MMRKTVLLTARFIAAVLACYVVASALSTQHVLGRVADMGLDVPLSVRLSSTAHDIVGMAPSFLPLIAIGCLIGFVVAALLARFAPGARTALYAAAGAVAVITIHLSLHAAFDIVPVASARTVAGLLGQGIAGALGGLTFSILTRRA